MRTVEDMINALASALADMHMSQVIPEEQRLEFTLQAFHQAEATLRGCTDHAEATSCMYATGKLLLELQATLKKQFKDSQRISKEALELLS